MVMKFGLRNGLYVSEVDTTALCGSIGKNISSDIGAYVLATIDTVAKNESAHTARDVARTKTVLPLIQALLGYPSRKSLTKMLNAKAINNCPVTVADVNRFYRIYGGIEGAVKQKTMRKLLADVNIDENTTAIPRSLADELKKVTMALDIFYVERMPFLTSISRKLMFTTGKAIKNRRHDEVMAAITEMASFYKIHGHQIEFIMSDNEFGPLKERIRKAIGSELNLAAPDEHVPEVERNIRVIKDRLRSMLAGMPYKKIPRHFKRELALTCITMLNVIPREASVSSSLSPMELLSGRSLDF